MQVAIPVVVRWSAGLLTGAALLGGSLALGAHSQAPAGVVRQKVSLAGIPVGGKTRDEVERLARDLSARLLGLVIRVEHGKQTERASASRLGARTDVKSAVDAVFAAGAPEDGLLDRLRDRLSSPDPVDVPLPVVVDGEVLAKALARFSVRIGAEAGNARLTTVKGKLTPIPPRPGKELDSDALARALEAALNAAELRARINPDTLPSPGTQSAKSAQSVASWSLSLPVVTRDAPGRITLDHLAELTAVLSQFSTGLGGSSRNRIHNVGLACRAIDGTVLLPGDTFSYNETVGPRVPSAGFREAPVIVKGELQPGTGGGVCQVSTTLYNAALLSDMQIVRRSHHAFPVHYVPAGRDATVVDGAIDFRFKNRLAHPVAVDAKVIGRRVVMKVYGHRDDRVRVEISAGGLGWIGAGAETVSDPRLPKGKRVVVRRAKSGRRVTVTRTVKRDGELLRRDVVSRDYYRPFAGLVRVGTAEAPKASPTAVPAAVPAPAPTPAPGPGPVDSGAARL